MQHLSKRTDSVVTRARSRFNQPQKSPVGSPTTSTINKQGRHVIDHSDNEIRDALHVARNDHMSEVDQLLVSL